MTLLDRLPATPEPPDPDVLFDVFETWVTEQGLMLYAAQEEALIELVSGANVILSTPTGTGKSLVATGAHLAALARGERTFYTAPIKALVSEKFFALIAIFGAENVGMLTGDAAVNSQAPLICCRDRPGGDGRVPLLLRARPGLGLAGAAARAPAGAVPADVRDARRRQPV